MKRMVATMMLFLTLFIFTSCNTHEDVQNFNYEEGIYYDKNWSEKTGTYTEDVVPTKEAAVAIATAVYNGIDKSQSMSNFTPQSVFFDKQDEIWIVSFGTDSKENIVGGDCSIAIQKQDGRVLRIWFGE